jgi:hypothetical protein
LIRLPKYAYQLEFWIFFIVGSVFLLIAASSVFNTLFFLVKAESVPGTVIDGYVPKIAFREETTKRRFEFIPSLDYSLTTYNEDERITVYYDPENPGNAKIVDLTNIFTLPTFFSLLCALCFLCGLLSSKDKT